MKKSRIVILLLFTILSIVLISKIDIVYAGEPDILWLEKEYYMMGEFYDSLAAVGLDFEYGFIDKTGKEVIPLKYSKVSFFNEGLVRVELNDKSGYIDKSGKQVIDFKYDDAGDFSEGLGAVKLNNKWGYIGKDGREVVELQYDYAGDFSDGLSLVGSNKKWGYIDLTGREMIPLKYDDAGNFSEGIASVNLNDKWGYIDKSGKQVIGLKYDYGYYFSEGRAMVKLNDKWGYIDKLGKEVIPFKYDNVGWFSEGLADVMLDGKYGYIDKVGKEVIPFKYDLVSWFSEGLAYVLLDDKWGYIDKTGKEVIPFKYDLVNDFSEGLALVSLENKLGIIKNPLIKQQDPKPILPQVKSMLATPTSSKVLVNGKDISFEAYLIDGNNYFKLRDLAFVVNGTKKQFEVKWDGNKKAIKLISDKYYTPDGGEMAKGKGIVKVPTLNKSSIYKDGVELKLIAYGIDGNNYFKLRDIAKAFDIGVTYDNITKVIGIDTSLSYTENEANKEAKVVILSPEEHRKINIFFSNFSEMWFSDFDSNNYNIEELLDFAYMNTKINNVASIKYEGSYYYIDKSNVEKIINKYFGLNINHGSVGKFEYRNGRYYIPAADGDNYFGFSYVDKLIDNKDGTFTANISIYDYKDNNLDYSGVPDKYYNIKSTWEKPYNEYEYYGSAVAKVKSAVVDGKKTYQLLDYKVKYLD